jgi:hypothetical protein
MALPVALPVALPMAPQAALVIAETYGETGAPWPRSGPSQPLPCKGCSVGGGVPCSTDGGDVSDHAVKRRTYLADLHTQPGT